MSLLTCFILLLNQFVSFCRDGSEKGLPAVATGSHIDAIPFSGKYDGVVGVLGALEAINVLRRLQIGRTI